MNSATTQVSLGATFSDGTKYTSLILSATSLALPGLVNFTLDATQAARINSSTGVITLLNKF